MSKSCLLVVSLTVLLAIPQTLGAQAANGNAGAFQRAYPEASALLQRVEQGRADWLERLAQAPEPGAAELEDAAFEELRRAILTGSVPAERTGSEVPALPGLLPRLRNILERAHDLQREIYDIYADDRVVDRIAAVDAAVERYLADAEHALPAIPRSMTIPEGEPHSTAFRTRYPELNGLAWAGSWLQLALYDPLMFYATREERESGVERVVARFEEMLAGGPESFPTEMPTPAAISPELTRRHPQAAAIFHTLHLLEGSVADILSHYSPGERPAVLAEATAIFTDPDYRAVPTYDWLAMSLRHGIYNQGGPAIGRLERSERNASSHAGHYVIPSMMSGMGSGPMGEVIVDEPDGAGQAPPAEHGGH